MKPEDLACLGRIKEQYGAAINLAAMQYRHRPEVLAGIMLRETRGGESSSLDVPGPSGRGDRGHGHGLMQIDDRSFPEFCAGDDWKSPAQNIMFAARILDGKRRSIVRLCIRHQPSIELPQAELERAAVAAYNCGEGNVFKSIVEGKDVDARTAHGDYSKTVLAYAEAYKEAL